MKCSDCGSSKAYKRKGVAWRLCRPCWVKLLAILDWANDSKAEHFNAFEKEQIKRPQP
jgi:hypothetical protein